MGEKLGGIGRPNPLERKRDPSAETTEGQDGLGQDLTFEDPAVERVGNEIAQRHVRELDADMEYHKFEHPRSVWGRMQVLGKILKIDDHTMNVGYVAGLGHDLVQDADITPYNPDDPTTIVKMRARHRGMYEGDNPPFGKSGNEGRTAGEVIAYMDQVNQEAGRVIYDQEDKALAEFMIACTYPEFGFNPFEKRGDEKPEEAKRREYYTAAIQGNPQIAEIIEDLQGERNVTAGLLIWAKHLDDRLDAAMEAASIPEKEARFLKAGFMMSQADLGSSVMEESGKFFAEGDKEFIESYPNLKDPEVKKLLMTEGGDANDTHSPAGARKLVAGEMLKWLNIQVGVAAWQGVSTNKRRMQMEHLGLLDSLQSHDLDMVCGRADDNARSAAFRASPADSDDDQFFGERGAYERALAGKSILRSDGSEVPGNEYNAFIQLSHAMHYHPEA